MHYFIPIPLYIYAYSPINKAIKYGSLLHLLPGTRNCHTLAQECCPVSIFNCYI